MHRLLRLASVLGLAVGILLLGLAPQALADPPPADPGSTSHSQLTLEKSCAYTPTPVWRATPAVPVLGPSSGNHPLVVGQGVISVRANASCAQPMARIKLEAYLCPRSQPCHWTVSNQTVYKLLPTTGLMPLRITAPVILGTNSYRVEIQESHTEMGLFLNSSGQRIQQLKTSGKTITGRTVKLSG